MGNYRICGCISNVRKDFTAAIEKELLSHLYDKEHVLHYGLTSVVDGRTKTSNFLIETDVLKVWDFDGDYRDKMKKLDALIEKIMSNDPNGRVNEIYEFEGLKIFVKRLDSHVHHTKLRKDIA